MDLDFKPEHEEKVAVVGCGNWGRNLVRNFYNLNYLHTVCDLNQVALQEIQKNYAGVHVTGDFSAMLQNPDICAAVISTPSHTHYRLARAALLANKHVYVEKPIATSGRDVLELFTLAQEMDRVLMVGHLLLYHPVVDRLRQLIAEGVLGSIQNIESDRLNTNVIRPDRSVLWDLAPHDVSMISYILGESPDRVVSAVGYSNHDDGLVDDVHLDLAYPGEVGGHIHVSWVHPIKQVKLVVRGTEGTAMIDDTRAEGKLQIFNKNDELSRVEEFPEYLTIEPLKLECQHFINCIRSGKRPKTDGVNGFKVVEILEEAENRLELQAV